MLGLNKTMAAVIGLCVTALVLGLPPCYYSIPEYGGTPCNQLPPPPPGATWDSYCYYYFCDENDPGDTEPTIWTKKTRKRTIYRAGANPVQYYDGGLGGSDVEVGCCHCED